MIGPEFAMLLSSVGLCGHFDNRRQVAGYGILQFATDATLPARITRLPEQLDGALEDLSGAEVATR